MRNCLVVCATKEDAACGVAAQIANTLRGRGVPVDLECARDVSNIAGYDAVIMGAALCHGRWRRPARQFLKRHREILQSTDVAVFALGPCETAHNEYSWSWNRLVTILTHLGWLNPVRIEVFPSSESDESFPCGTADATSAVGKWCQNLDVSMHLSDGEIPNERGVI